jgi:hypothetical protein
MDKEINPNHSRREFREWPDWIGSVGVQSDENLQKKKGSQFGTGELNGLFEVFYSFCVVNFVCSFTQRHSFLRREFNNSRFAASLVVVVRNPRWSIILPLKCVDCLDSSHFEWKATLVYKTVSEHLLRVLSSPFAPICGS